MSARFDDHAAERTTPLREQLLCLMRDLRASVAARVEVAQVELNASAHEMIGGGVALAGAALFAIGAWVTACALFVAGLAAAGLSWLTALVVVTLANAALSVFALMRARRHLRHISLSHTYRAFLGRPQREEELAVQAARMPASPLRTETQQHQQRMEHGTP